MRSGVLTRLGHISVARFMREHWQRRPVMVRGAFPGFLAPVRREELFALAGRDDVESRLVVRRGSRWTLRHGPFDRRQLPAARQPGWTLLLQGLDLVSAGAHELLARFRFIPDARLDDLMASFATDGGGVGPHADNYDVFLIQGQGRRRWRISRQRDLGLQPGMPLKLLAQFRPSREWVLEPGDLLYLPPGTAHEGIAEGPCITYSIGFRAPAYQELLDPWLASFAEHREIAGRYTDPGLRPTMHPGRLMPAMVSRVHKALSRARPARTDTERFLLEFLSEPKSQVVFRTSRRALSPAAFHRAACRRGITLDRRSRMLVGHAGLGFNGEYFPAEEDWLSVLRRLADERALGPGELAGVAPGLLALLHQWTRAAWLGFPRRRS
jgi:50S ribosomal protein L16 3-hydroxylase